MPYLADTNIVVRWLLPHDPDYAAIRTAVLRLQARRDPVYVTPQVLVEFQALATRPAEANGLGMTTAEASRHAVRLEAVFPMLPDTPDIYPLWRALVDTYDVRGRQVYDARLVAVMLAHGVTHILTLNPSHFRRFTEITVVAPRDVGTGP